jgi:hypothetical protein
VVDWEALSPEESLLWLCARTWRSPKPPPSPAVNWSQVVTTAIANKMPALLDHYLAELGLAEKLPAEAAGRLRDSVERYRQNAALLSEALAQYLDHAARVGQDVVVLKGLWVAIKLYGRADLRPGGDIDLLLRAEDIAGSLRIIEEKLACGRYWRPLLDDRYYSRHHLHQQRCSRDLALWFEPHWAFDHPYTRLTIDYRALLARTTAGELLGQPVRELALPDLLLSLAIHLVKHAVYLPATLGRGNLARAVLADGMVMNYLDIAELLRRWGEALDWQKTVDLARQWGACELLSATLRACYDLLGAPAPRDVLAGLPVERPGPITRRLMAAMVEHKVATYQGKKASRLWSFLVGYRASLVFRPIRLLDLAHYFFPGRDYLRRRYGSASLAAGLGHLGRAIVEHGRIAADTVYYTWQRNRRLRLLERRQPHYFASPAEVKGH